MRRTLTVLSVFSLLLSSCTVGPDYKPDHIDLPDHFTSEPHPATPEEIADMERGLKDWWKRFNDPVLDKLIERAIKGNYNLMAATQRVTTARAMRREAQSDWYPQLDANAGGGNTRYSTAIDNYGFRPYGNPPPPLNGGHPGTGVWSSDGRDAWNYAGASILTYGAKANWELDVFGKIARQVQAQTYLAQATIEDRRAVLLSLLSQVATDYIILRGTQERIKVVEGAIEVAQGAYDLVNRLFISGVGNNLVVAQSLSELHSEKARLPRLHGDVEAMKHALADLMGEMPGEELPDLDRVQPMPKMPEFPATLPSIVIANRPDIRASERRYAMGMANIGVAIAQLYPNFNIPLNFNPNASALYQAFSLYGMSWNFMMMASIPVLHGGKYTAQIGRARAEAEASRVIYRQTVLDAFREIEDRMDDWEQNAKTVVERNHAQVEAALARDRARRLFVHGVTNFLNVLVTEQQALSAKDEWVLSRIQRLEDGIGLYIAIGAGWQGDELADTRLPVEKEQQSVLARAFTR